VEHIFLITARIRAERPPSGCGQAASTEEQFTMATFSRIVVFSWRTACPGIR
jgi:hypothetical protein